MPLVTLEGVYRDGKVELTEAPEGAGEDSRVLVTFLTGAPDGELDSVSDERDRERKTAIERLLARLNRGFHLGGGPYYESREEIYEERLVRFAPRDG